MMYDMGVGALTAQQGELLRTQQQMASQRRLLSAADDPAAAATALRVSQSLARNQQIEANQQAAANRLAIGESALSSVGDVLQGVQERLLQAQNATLSTTERSVIAADVDNMLGQLLSLANSKDGSGAYLFAGYAETTTPFVAGAGGVAYQGDDGARTLEVASGRNLAVSASGSDIFMRVKTGNGVFATAANPANTGAGRIDSGSVANPSALTGNAYELTFNVAGAVTTYDVFDVTAGATVSSGNAFTAGQSITVAGMQFGITGGPANGDRFSAAPSSNQSVFKTIADATAALRSGGNDALRHTRVNAALANLDQSMNRALTVRAEFGSRMNEISAHQNVSGAVVLEHQRRISELQDVDYTEAATRLMRQETATQAAQQSFARVAQLSLFNYLG